ncbi:MAG TPA: VanZ family protein [Burkholderiaceae bacterium]|nr:VanZ family protein [Burkholderiaceae bacterium]
MSYAFGRESAALPGPQRPHDHRLALRLWLAWTAFVIYGSLVPLDFVPVPLDEAWRRFSNAPLLHIGAGGRADLIANFVLYVPSGFLCAHWLLRRGVPGWISAATSSVLAAALAVSVEFAQVFFPPRTVSLNDMTAEALGAVGGAAAALWGSRWFSALLASGRITATRMREQWLAAYLLAWFAYSLFPYDFVLNAAELRGKLTMNEARWWWAGSGAGPAAILTLALEVVTVVPIGVWLARRRGFSVGGCAVAGLTLGVMIEGLQFLLVSGVSQGASVLTRVLGVATGAMLSEAFPQLSASDISKATRRHLPWLLPAYIGLLLVSSGLFAHPWADASHAMATWREMRWMPFYYHYYTSEAHALRSLVAVAFAYVPFGLLAWTQSRPARFGSFLAAIAACMVEGIKLFLDGAKPDPTNVLIAAAAAGAAWELLTLGFRSATAERTAHSPPVEPVVEAPALGIVPWLLVLAAVAAVVALFPAQRVVLALVLATALITCWHHPSLALAWAVAALPVFDLAVWTGRLLIDEFDLLLLVVTSTAWLRARPMAPAFGGDVALRLAFGAAIGALLLAGLHGMLPWRGAEGWETLHGSLNAIRVGKGALWAAVLALLASRLQRNGRDTIKALAAGAVIGIALVVLSMLHQHLAASPLDDFFRAATPPRPLDNARSREYGVEAYLVAAFSFLLLAAAGARRVPLRMLLVGVSLAFAAAVAFRYTLAGSVALLAVVLMMGMAFVRSRSVRSVYASAPLSVFVLVLVAAVLSVAVRASDRGQGEADVADIEEQLHRVPIIATLPRLARNGPLLGIGLGKFPETWFWRVERQGNVRVLKDDGRPFMRLGSGKSGRLEQIVPVRASEAYVFELDVRSPSPQIKVSVSVCEKAMETSFSCIELEARANEPERWQHIRLPFNTDTFDWRPSWLARNVVLTIRTPDGNDRIDIARLSLRDRMDRKLLRNGDFADGIHNWLFASDNPSASHAGSLPLMLWVESGVFGLATIGALVALALLRGARSIWEGDLAGAAAVSALVGWLVIGSCSAIINDPRLLLAFLALAALSAGGLRSRQHRSIHHGSVARKVR